MKHSITALLSVAALAATLPGCTNAAENAGSASGATDVPESTVSAGVDDKAAALVPEEYKSTTLSVAIDASYPPFQFFDEDNTTIVGFDAEFSMAVLERMGLEGKVVNAGFDSILTGLAGGRYDMAESSFSVTPEREEVVDFVEYLQGGAGIAVTPGNPLDLAMDPMTLCGHTIAAQKGTTQAIEQLPDIAQQCQDAGKEPLEAKLFPSQNDAVLALASGRVDGMMADSTAISYQGKLSGDKFELAPGDIYEARPTGIALPEGSALKPAVSAAVKSLYADGTVDELAKKWSIPASNYASNPGA